VVAPGAAATPSDPLALGKGLVTVTASFTDSPGQVRTCTVDWGDGSVADAGVVVEPTATEPGSCTGVHLYTATGVYAVSLTVADPCAESAAAVRRYAVVYDGNSAFVTGGGWIDSPPGAFVADRALTGKAEFGFGSPYGKGNVAGAVVRADLRFHLADFEFASTAWDPFVISGAKVRLRGTGQVNGAGRFGFALTAVDGQGPGGGGVDRLRIQIWDMDRGDAVVYDNQVACGSQGDNADPCTPVAGSVAFLKK